MPTRFRNCTGPSIRKLRSEHGWTQDDLAAKLQLAGLESMSRVSVAKVESQIRSVYDYELALIAEVLGCTSTDLMPPLRSLKPQLTSLAKGEKIE